MITKGAKVVWAAPVGGIGEGIFSAWIVSPSGGRLARVIFADGGVGMVGEKFLRLA